MRQINMTKPLLKYFLCLSFVISSAPNLALAQSDFLSKFRQYRINSQVPKKEDQDKKIAEIDSELAKTTDAEDKRLLLMAKALMLLDFDRVDQAQSLLQDLLKEKNNLVEYVHYFYGRSLAKQQKFSEAKQHFEKLMDLSPNAKMQIEAQTQLAEIALTEKNFRQAKNLLTRLERRQRREEGYPEVIYLMAQAERGLGAQGPFCRWVKKLYTQYPQYSRIQSWGPNLATDEFEGRLTRCPVTQEERRRRIKNLQWAGFNQKAIEEIQTLRTQTSTENNYEVDRLEVGYWLHEGEVQKAMNLLLPYYESHKNDINYLNQLAVVAARSGEYQAAVGSYYLVYKLAPRGKFGKQALYQSAFMSYQFQDYDGAARKFQEFMKVYASSGLSRDARWHLAWIRYLRGDYQGAYNSLSALLKESRRTRRGWKSFPKDRVTYWMAMSLLRMEKYSQARPLFESLAKDQLVGYYSVASQFRLKKLDQVSPRPSRVTVLDQTRRITRFSSIDSIIPPDDLPPSGEENESEETLVAQAMMTEEEAPAAEEVPTGDGTIQITQEETVPEMEEVKPSFANPVLVQRFERARDLMILGLNDWAKWDLYDIERKTSNKDYLKNLMQEYQTVDNYHRSAYIAQVFFGGQRALHGLDGVRYLWEFAYPRAYAQHVMKYTKQWDVAPELVWGIMRAESIYRKDAVSPVGALGLMQVMPGTGMRVAGLMNEKEFNPRSLLEPETAVKIGTRYLQRLDKKFEKNVPLVAAAYNAGPHRVYTWLSAFGNLEMDEFVEHIPFLETRNYVKKVVSNYQIYSILYANKKDNLSYIAESLKVKIPSKVASKETWEEL
jgi:soluble lytic murein transglycosylase